MATKCDAYRAETDNTLHATEKAATMHDLSIIASRLVHPSPTLLAANLAANADLTIRLLEAYRKAHPGAGGGKAPSEGRKGPTAAKDPEPDEGTCEGCERPESECICAKPCATRGRAVNPAHASFTDASYGSVEAQEAAAQPVGPARQFNDHG